MASTASGIRRLERLYDKLMQVKAEADKESYYYRKDTNLAGLFGEFSDIINNAVSSGRSKVTEAQAMRGYICPCMTKKPSSTTKRTSSSRTRRN